MRLRVGTLRQVVKRDLPIAFVPQQLTSYGGLELLRRYVRRIALPRRLQAACAALGGDYGGARYPSSGSNPTASAREASEVSMNSRTCFESLNATSAVRLGLTGLSTNRTVFVLSR